jgi:hypothetical protein
VTVDNLEDEHATRNARLMRMLQDLHVVENRGSGVRAVVEALRAANLEPPRFDDRRSSLAPSVGLALWAVLADRAIPLSCGIVLPRRLPQPHPHNCETDCE